MYIPSQFLRNVAGPPLTAAEQRELDRQMGVAAATFSRSVSRWKRRAHALARVAQPTGRTATRVSKSDSALSSRMVPTARLAVSPRGDVAKADREQSGPVVLVGSRRPAACDLPSRPTAGCCASRS
jgi:hypothetical protein